jgi:DNA mismatch repair protein MutS2
LNPAQVIAPPKTLQDLGFAALHAALAQRCRTEVGRARALARPFCESATEVQDALARVAEARALAEQKLSLPLSNVVDVRGSCDRATRGGLLEPRELLGVSQVLFAFERIREALEEREHAAPGLAVVARRLPLQIQLASRIEGCFEPSGELADRASPALREARDRVHALHGTIKTRLDRLLHDEKFSASLRENYFSVRNDRYVVPVQAQYRAEVPGIVHNASQTGQTLFVEPEALIGLGNDLAIAQSLVVEEERRILLELSDQVGREAERIVEGVLATAELDEAEACALLANDLGCEAPEVMPADGPLELRSVRHPLLALSGSPVVPNDVRLSGILRALVVSGPNAGGKTVTLTTVGLCVLMLRAGLPIPAAPGSRLPLYRAVHSAIGDAQDLEKGLSTFSAHVVQLRDIQERVGTGALVLIDEIAADTDPREGAAIAIAVLENLIERGATVLVTTHLEEVKALAHMDARFQNARVGFDSGKMAPTYRLQLGQSGASSAIDIARRMGLPATICDRARELAVSAGGPLAQALAAAEEDRRRLSAELDRARVAAAAAEAERDAASLARREAETRRLQDEARHQEALRRVYEDALKEAREVLEAARAAEKAAEAARQEKRLAERAQDAARKAAEAKARLQPEAAPEKAGDLRVGGLARHVGLNQKVEVLSIGDGEAVVSAGLMKMRARLEDLVPLAGGAQKGKFPGESAKDKAMARAAKAAAAPIAAGSGRLDVRGMRAEEAVGSLEQYLDRAMSAGEESVTVLHGHGTGALKKTVREYLDRSAYVRMYRPGSDEEGGDGLTVVSLKG